VATVTEAASLARSSSQGDSPPAGGQPFADGQPSPVPPKRSVVKASAWQNGSKTVAACTAVMPIPVSMTSNPIRPCWSGSVAGSIRGRERRRCCELHGVVDQVDEDSAGEAGRFRCYRAWTVVLDIERQSLRRHRMAISERPLRPVGRPSNGCAGFPACLLDLRQSRIWLISSADAFRCG